MSGSSTAASESASDPGEGPEADAEEVSHAEAVAVPTEVTPVAEATVLGRYELLQELGTGGMASVFLARASGPAGFQKWFAIKRIHPHLAKETRFVEMFLDEARIAASVQHPNVAQVVELGAIEGDYFLTMEYLHGEHLGRLTARAVKEEGHLPFEEAAWIAARAAAGLHAAHESVDATGRRMDLVHRDVSPQNIFLTYDGQVKVTDFGVARAANRISHTTTGTAKGKCAYMAPEQATGGEMDRRADVFALGIVLWETTVGRRLFKRKTDAQTLMKVMRTKVPKPSSMVHDYPKELERIVLKALKRRPEDRYVSAAALEHDLEIFLEGRERKVTQRAIKALMDRHFADQRAARDRLLRSAAEHVPAPTSSDRESLDDLPTVGSSPRTLPSQSAIRPLLVPRRRWIPVLALGLVGGVAAAFMVGEEEPVAPPGSLRIESSPAGARLTLDGEAREGATPVQLDDLSPGRHTLRLELDGHEPVETTFDVTAGERARLSYVLPAATGDDGAGDDAVGEDAVDEAPPPNETAAAAEEAGSMEAAEADGAETRARPRRAPGYVKVVALPYATVRINGGRARTTPTDFIRVRPGRVTLRYQVRGEGPVRSQRVDIDPGARETVRLRTR